MVAISRNRATSRWAQALSRIDFWLLASVAFLTAVGLLCLYSVDHAGIQSSYLKKQLLHIAEGLLPFALFLFVDPRVWRKLAGVLYVLNLALLVFVLLKGKEGGGAQRWIQLGPLDFQPSELAKLIVVLTLAAFLISRREKIKSFLTFFFSFLYVLVPLALVFKQPHLGATLVILVSWLCVCLVAGVRIRYLAGTVVAVTCLIVAGYQVPGLLKPYQVERLHAMLNPRAQGNAYQPIRAQIAFAAGGVTGTGWLKGKQKAAHYIPEQQNDFVFTVVGEEGGLLGCTLVLLAYAVFFYRVWLIVLQADEPYYQMLAAGIFAILGFHTIVNLCMNLQLLPVVGLWLPFISYGGTAMWLCMGSLALLLNIRSRQRPALF